MYRSQYCILKRASKLYVIRRKYKKTKSTETESIGLWGSSIQDKNKFRNPATSPYFSGPINVTLVIITHACIHPSIHECMGRMWPSHKPSRGWHDLIINLQTCIPRIKFFFFQNTVTITRTDSMTIEINQNRMLMIWSR